MGISLSKFSSFLRVYQSYPPMIRKALFWKTYRRFMLHLEMKGQAEEAYVISGRMYALKIGNFDLKGREDLKSGYKAGNVLWTFPFKMLQLLQFFL